MTLEYLFTTSRTFSAWLEKPVDFKLVRQAYEMASLGPTSMNSQPMRIMFLVDEASKRRLLPHLVPANVDKSRDAPVVAIIGYDRHFFAKLPVVFPHKPDAKKMFEVNHELAEETAFRNSAMQGAYFLICLRAMGLDCGPVSGFNTNAVDAEFWKGTSVRTNFICNIGYGDRSKLFEKAPRLPFSEACIVA